jgi:hypothetical protein
MRKGINIAALRAAKLESHYLPRVTALRLHPGQIMFDPYRIICEGRPKTPGSFHKCTTIKR